MPVAPTIPTRYDLIILSLSSLFRCFSEALPRKRMKKITPGQACGARAKLLRLRLRMVEGCFACGISAPPDTCPMTVARLLTLRPRSRILRNVLLSASDPFPCSSAGLNPCRTLLMQDAPLFQKTIHLEYKKYDTTDRKNDRKRELQTTRFDTGKYIGCVLFDKTGNTGNAEKCEYIRRI